MKNILIILFVLAAFLTNAQTSGNLVRLRVDTLTGRSGSKVIYIKDTLIFTDGSKLYSYTGGGGGADSSVFATRYYLSQYVGDSATILRWNDTTTYLATQYDLRNDTNHVSTSGDNIYGTIIIHNSSLTQYSGTNSEGRGSYFQQYSGDSYAANINLGKGRGTALSPTIITTGDTLGRIYFSGYDGSTMRKSAAISAMSTGTIGANRTPSILRFLTSTDASPSVLTERMIITEAGNIGIGNTTPLAKLQVTTTTNGNPTNTYKGIAIFDAGNGIGLSIGGSPSNNSMYLQSVLPISSGSNAYNLKLQPTGGKLAIFTESIDYDISIGGDAARILSLVRNTISNTAGSSLTLGSGGATSGATNKAAGNIILSTGTSTGSASADFQIFTPTPDGSGTTDRVPVKREDLFTRILADNGTVALASGRSGIGIITVGDGEEYAWFSFTTAGVVTLVTNSSNVTTTQGTNDKINIYDAGSNVTIENTFTASKVLTVKILYNL